MPDPQATDREALRDALDAACREWEDYGGSLFAILLRHATPVVEQTITNARAEAERQSAIAVAAEHHRMVERVEAAEKERDQRHDGWAQSVKNEAALHREIEQWRSGTEAAKAEAYAEGVRQAKAAAEAVLDAEGLPRSRFHTIRALDRMIRAALSDLGGDQ